MNDNPTTLEEIQKAIKEVEAALPKATDADHVQKLFERLYWLKERQFNFMYNGGVVDKVSDVTNAVVFGGVDEERLPIYRCVCGTRFTGWSEVLSIYEKDPWQCPVCETRLFFRASVRVFKVS